ncbi:hypothetical protein VTJ49DRAFT_7019 [Mycothermus thermophilus]|uniref:Heterokaryon incompatibility domain-containing protein n=1 Tax=Humicola insolens TaxID=85995 RepID=A0ABR3VHU5_HUMIN
MGSFPALKLLSIDYAIDGRIPQEWTGLGTEQRVESLISRSAAETISHTYKQVVYLWIDALCIDQSNSTQEKATQIPLIGETYSLAARVLD